MRYLYDVSSQGEPPGGRRTRPARASRPEPAYEDLGIVERRPRAVRQRRSEARSIGWFLLAAVLVLAAVGGGFLANALRARSPGAVNKAPGTARNVVIFVIDGAGPQDFSGARLPSIRKLSHAGTTYADAWAGSPVLSSAESNASLATGVFPSNHGIQGQEWQATGSTQPAGVLTPAQVSLGSIDQTLEASSVTPFAGAIKNTWPGSKILSVGGEGCAAASSGGTWIADYVVCPARHGKFWTVGSVAGHEPTPNLDPAQTWERPIATGKGLGPTTEGWLLGRQDDWIAAYAAWVMRKIHPRLTIVNFPEIEAVAPWALPGARPGVVEQLMRGIDTDIGRIVAQTRVWAGSNRTTYVLTSDGPISKAVGAVPFARLQEAVAAAGAQTTFLVGGPLAVIGLKEQLQLFPAVQALEAEKIAGTDMVFSKRRAGAKWTYVLRWARSSVSRRARDAVTALMQNLISAHSPDLVVVPRPGMQIGQPRLGPLFRNGIFGGISWPAEHIPLILSGNGVVSGQESLFPARLVDVAPTLEFVLGLPVSPTEGIVLADSLSAPTLQQISHQSVRSRQVRALVRYLESWT